MLARHRPRVSLAPRATRSDGDDAYFLADSYGLTPDDWQEDILEGWLGRRRDGRFAAATCGLAVPRQNGKNALIEIRELFGMVELGEKFLHTAHEVKTARKAFLRIASFFENERRYPELAALVRDIRKTNGQEAVILANGGSVEFIARSRGSGRGFTVDVLVCDEAQDLTDEELAALLPTISAAPLRNPQVILTGTPPDPERLDAPQGEVFRRVRRDGEARADLRLAWTDFGVPDGPLPDVEDRELWERVNPALGIRLALAEVERERGLMSPEMFARERLGWWGDPNSLGGIFGSAWDACRTEDRHLDGSPYMAIAATFELSHVCIGGATVSDDLVWVKPLRHGRGTDWVAAEALELQAQHGGDFVIDERGPASALITSLIEAGIRLQVIKTADLLDACGQAFDGIQNRRWRHMSHPELESAVHGARWRDVGDRRAFGRKAGYDISPLEAVTLAAWAAAQATNYDPLESVL